jgi:acetyl esterase/lipase
VTGRMRANFVAVDYRGFGDSQKVAPSEDGLVLDAHATWDWLVAKGVRPQNIVLIGASLGAPLRLPPSRALKGARHWSSDNSSSSAMLRRH